MYVQEQERIFTVTKNITDINFSLHLGDEELNILNGKKISERDYIDIFAMLSAFFCKKMANSFSLIFHVI